MQRVGAAPDNIAAFSRSYAKCSEVRAKSDRPVPSHMPWQMIRVACRGDISIWRSHALASRPASHAPANSAADRARRPRSPSRHFELERHLTAVEEKWTVSES